ncbi:hypothetical protein Efla_005025 [Eimeria flavescens]
MKTLFHAICTLLFAGWATASEDVADPRFTVAELIYLNMINKTIPPSFRGTEAQEELPFPPETHVKKVQIANREKGKAESKDATPPHPPPDSAECPKPRGLRETTGRGQRC